MNNLSGLAISVISLSLISTTSEHINTLEVMMIRMMILKIVIEYLSFLGWFKALQLKLRCLLIGSSGLVVGLAFNFSCF